MSNTPKHPDVTVKLTGEDGNAFSIISRVSNGLRRAGYRDSAEEVKRKLFECQDYDSVLQMTMEYVEVE